MTRSGRTILSFTCCILFLLPSTARAGNGKINGWVRAAASGLPLQASVEVLGTGIGAATDSAGRFVLMNVPPGTHTLKSTAVGWTPTTYEGVVLYENQILTLSFPLTPQEIVLTETIIESPRPAIDPSKMSAWTRFETGDFTELPVHTAAQVVSLSAASFGESVRGGRAHQTSTIVDGIDITDRYEVWYGEVTGGYGGVLGRSFLFPVSTTNPRSPGAALLEPPLSSIDQGGLFAGASGVEYAGVSGAVSYTLRAGRGRWSGSAYARISQLGGLTHLGPDIYNDQAVYAAEKAKRATSTLPIPQWESTVFTWTPGKYSYGDDPDIEGGVGIGGPLWDDAGLYLTAGLYDTHGRLPGVRFRQFDGTLKFSLSPGNSTRLGITALLEDRGRLLGWKNRPYIDQYRYYLEGIPSTDGVSAVGGVRFTHMLGPRSFYEIQLSANYRSARTGYCDDNNDGLISLDEDGEFLTWGDTAQVNRYQATGSLALQPEKFFAAKDKGVLITPVASKASFVVAGPPIRYKDISTLTYSAQVLFSSTAGPHHTLTSGLRATLHDISVLSREGAEGIPKTRNYVEESWTRRPREFNAYIQDQMEYSGLFVNAGLRVDVFDLKSSDYLNWFRPFQLQTSPSGIEGFSQIRGPEIPARAYFSPRLAVSHPVSERTAVHFSMSMAQDLLPYSELFRQYRLDGSLGRLVRISQESQRSTSYDFGLQWSPIDEMAIDVNAYQKDYENYFAIDWGTSPSVWIDYPGSPIKCDVMTSHGSVLSRGLELTLQIRRTALVSFLNFIGRASYSYSYAIAGLESGLNRTEFSALAGDSALYGGTLPFDEFDKWNKTFVHICGGSSASLRGYDRRHKITCNGIFSLPADFSLSVTGRFASGFYYPLQGPEPYVTEWGEGPWNKQIDFRLEKGFSLGGSLRFSLYVDLINAFNWVNIVAFTGDWDVLGAGTIAWMKNGDPTGGPLWNRPVTSWEGTLLYGVPREAYFGAQVDF